MDEDGDSSVDMITYGYGDGDDERGDEVRERESKREIERLKISKTFFTI